MSAAERLGGRSMKTEFPIEMHLPVGECVITIGATACEIGSKSYQTIANRFAMAALAVTRFARLRGDDESDFPEYLPAALEGAELLQEFARIFRECSAHPAIAETEARRARLVGMAAPRGNPGLEP